MSKQSNTLQCTSDYDDDWRVFSVLCGIPGLEVPLVGRLQDLGLHPAAGAPTRLLFDLPCGFAVQQLPRLAHSPVRLIIVTYNPCPEYWEDVWELQPAGLAVNLPFDQTLLDTLEATARGERRRLTPPMMSSLTATERRLLRCVARGWDNRRIAQHLHVEEKSVRNRLTHVYAKIPVSNRVEAALYYWGRVDLFT